MTRIVDGGGFVKRTKVVRREPEANRARVVLVAGAIGFLTVGFALYSAQLGWIWLGAYAVVAIETLVRFAGRIPRLAKLGTESTETVLVARSETDEGDPINPRNLY